MATPVEQIQAETQAIIGVMQQLDKLERDSQRRVMWYVADTLGLNGPPQPRPVNQSAVRAVPLPAGVDAQAAAEAMRGMGVPVRNA